MKYSLRVLGWGVGLGWKPSRVTLMPVLTWLPHGPATRRGSQKLVCLENLKSSRLTKIEASSRIRELTTHLSSATKQPCDFGQPLPCSEPKMEVDRPPFMGTDEAMHEAGLSQGLAPWILNEKTKERRVKPHMSPHPWGAA